MEHIELVKVESWLTDPDKAGGPEIENGYSIPVRTDLAFGKMLTDRYSSVDQEAWNALMKEFLDNYNAALAALIEGLVRMQN